MKDLKQNQKEQNEMLQKFQSSLNENNELLKKLLDSFQNHQNK